MVGVPRQWPSPARANPLHAALICAVSLVIAGVAGALFAAVGPAVSILVFGALIVGVSFALVWYLVVTAPADDAVAKSVDGRFVDLCLFAMCLTFSWSGIWRGLEGFRLVDIPLLVLFLYGLLRGYPLHHRVVAIVAFAFALNLLGTLLAATASTDHRSDVIAFARMGFVTVVVPLVLIRFVDTPRRLRIVLLGLVLSGAVGAAFAILRQFTGRWVLPILDLFAGTREYGLSDHPVMLGIATASALLLMPVLVLEARGARALIALLCAPVLLLGLVLSESRAPMVGLLLGGFVLVRGLVRHAPRIVFPLIWGAACFGILVLAAFPGSLERLAGAGTDTSSQSRLKLYGDVVDAIAASPLIGQGAGLVKGAGGLNPLADTQQFIQYATAIAYGEAGGAHNVWLQIWYAVGLAGLVGYALIALAPVAAAVVIIREGHRQTSMYAIALLAAYVVLLFSGLLYSTVFDRQVWLVPALILALWAHRQSSAWQ